MMPLSVVSMKLYYPEFNENLREQIWQTLVDKFAKDRGKDMRLHPDATYYLKSKEIQAVN